MKLINTEERGNLVILTYMDEQGDKFKEILSASL